MKNKIIALGLISLLAAGCETSDDEAAKNAAAMNSKSLNPGIYSRGISEVVPGSQEDLVANVGDRVFFEYNAATLGDNAQKTLARQAQWLAANPTAVITVEGHCDERGTREFNLALGERRAAAVKNYLLSLGVDRSRVSTISYGKERPEELGSSEAAWSKNRRAVTVVGQ
jgi:peptidoglycan-associated lipoprotein